MVQGTERVYFIYLYLKKQNILNIYNLSKIVKIVIVRVSPHFCF